MQGNSLLSESASRTSTTQTAPSKWRTLTLVTFLLLQVQFFIGMLVNLYIQIPTAHPGANSVEYFSGVVQGIGWALTSSPPALLIHVALGLLLIIASFTLLGLAIASRRLAWIISSTLGLIGVIGAGFNGASFLNYGHDFSSLLMSTSFLVATISYMLGFALTSQKSAMDNKTAK